MILRSRLRPDLGWGRPILAVLAGIILPAIPAVLYLWTVEIDQSAAMVGWDAIKWIGWLLAACLTATPLLAWLALPIIVPAVRFAAKRGWAGPLSVMGIAVAIGVPLAHVVLNGDLTTEAPEMIPFIVITLALQALCGWVILNGPKPVQGANAEVPAD